MRIPLYVYSNKNIAGCVLGIAALGAFFAGAIHELWYAIAAGAYAVGAIATPGDPALATQLSNEMNDQTMLESLHALVREARKRFPDDVFALVASIVTSIDAFMSLKATKKGTLDQAAFDVKQTATSYLPQTLSAYAALPPAYRSLASVSGGKTPKALLIDQLTLLDGKMREIAANAVANDAQDLIVNGRFLRDKFATADAFRV